MALALLLADYSEDVTSLVVALRAFLLARYPSLNEEVDFSSRLVIYRLVPGMKGVVFSLILSKNGVKLGIYRGIDLTDPAGLLEGIGKVHKYIQMNSNRFENEAFQTLLDSAVENARIRIGK